MLLYLCTHGQERAGQGSPVRVIGGSSGTLEKCPNAGSLPPQTEGSSLLPLCPKQRSVPNFLVLSVLLGDPGSCCSLVILVVLLQELGTEFYHHSLRNISFYILTFLKWEFIL